MTGPEIPIYLQLSQIIEDGILSGQIQAEEKVPSMQEFARLLAINPATAGKGLNELVDQGILYKKRGLGMFVTPQAKDILLEKRRLAFNQKTLPSFLKEASQLQLDQDKLIQLIKEHYK